MPIVSGFEWFLGARVESSSLFPSVQVLEKGRMSPKDAGVVGLFWSCRGRDGWVWHGLEGGLWEGSEGGWKGSEGGWKRFRRGRSTASCVYIYIHIYIDIDIYTHISL